MPDGTFPKLFYLGGGPKKAFGKENGLQNKSQGDWINVLSYSEWTNRIFFFFYHRLSQ